MGKQALLFLAGEDLNWYKFVRGVSIKLTETRTGVAKGRFPGVQMEKGMRVVTVTVPSLTRRKNSGFRGLTAGNCFCTYNVVGPALPQLGTCLAEELAQVNEVSGTSTLAVAKHGKQLHQ